MIAIVISNVLKRVFIESQLDEWLENCDLGSASENLNFNVFWAQIPVSHHLVFSTVK